MSDSLTSVYRILDANANRASEGLRVVEEYVRFVLDDRHLMGLCKHLRHDLTVALSSLDVARFATSRETQADVGTEVTTSSETHRADARDVAAASMKRVEQALRCLAEYGKTVHTSFADKCEQLRYRAYTLHRAIDITSESIQRLTDAKLYVLIDGAESESLFWQRATSLVQAGVHLLQLRDKRMNDRELMQRARLLRQATQGSNTLFIMNDRPDIAALAHADGVHVGQEELSVKDSRAIIGPDRLIGVSTHSLEQARQAVLDGANYIGCGPTFPSETKNFNDFPGLQFLRQVAMEIRLPAFAIGGITLQNIAQVRAAGFSRVAVAGAIANSPRPDQAVGHFLESVS